MNSLLLLVSILVGAAIAEGVARTVDDLPLFTLFLPQPIGADTAADHLDEVPRAAGVDRKWFFDSPPPLPNRTRAPEEWERLFQQIEKVHVETGNPFRGGDMFKAWNATLVADPCAHDFFRRAPGRLFIYDALDGLPYPSYRFLQNASGPDNLVTNQFGWRGPPARFARSEKTVRIVFVGASTTVSSHYMPHSYPEFVAHWLGLWARARGLDINFETLNAGREGVDSADIAAIVRQEVVPLRPDLVIYYEGANQFRLESIIRNVPGGAGKRPDEQVAHGTLALWLQQASRYLAIARRIEAATGLLGTPTGGRERPKPDYEVTWPKGLDEFNPDLGRPDLPVNLSAILGDLLRIRTDLADVGSELAISSFIWIVKDGMVLDPIRHRYILEQLNVANYPFHYRELERLAAFQNRVYAKFAATHHLPFIDAARAMPFDPNLFFDAIHKTYPGERMHGWVVFQQLVPIIEKRLASGAWPRPAPVMGEVHPAFVVAPRQITFECQPKAG